MELNELAKEIAEKARINVHKNVMNGLREELYAWLAELKFPGHSNGSEWQDVVIEREPTEAELKAISGVKVRFGIRLYTRENQYLISIFESLGPDNVGNFILTVHVNWQALELRKRQEIEQSYGSEFDPTLRPKHTIWAQTFREGGMAEALNSGAVAILGHELQPSPPKEKSLGETVKPQPTQAPVFPDTDDE